MNTCVFEINTNILTEQARFGLGVAADWMFGVHAAEPSWVVNDMEALRDLFRAAETLCDQNVVQWPRYICTFSKQRSCKVHVIEENTKSEQDVDRNRH